MTCMAIYGNGARTTGWTITLPPQEMKVLIKTMRTFIASHAVGHGMSQQDSVAVRHVFEYCSPRPRSLLDFGWFVRLSNVLKKGGRREFYEIVRVGVVRKCGL